MQKYVIVKFLEPIEPGLEFLANNWPLHVTLVANFVTDWNKYSFLERLEALALKAAPIQAIVTAEEYFGQHNDILVNPLKPNTSLVGLHKEIVALLLATGAIFDEPNYVNDGYRAHVTAQHNARLHEGDKVLINNLSLVDVFPDRDIKSASYYKLFPLMTARTRC